MKKLHTQAGKSTTCAVVSVLNALLQPLGKCARFVLCLMTLVIVTNPLQASDANIAVAAGDVRVAVFNVALNRKSQGKILKDLESRNDSQIQKVAEILQRVRPDIVLLNELDYMADGAAINALRDHYLEVSQNDADPIEYPHVYLAASNTGIPSGLDLDNNGSVGGGGDAFGFGQFAGQYAMALLSRYPIDTANVRTFQKFLWKDMPDAKLPLDPDTGELWYSDEELAVFRLSSKSHWDVPVKVGDKVIHILASHPTPPVFDGPEDRNGRRNHDEIRFWADYIDPYKSAYIYDDNGNKYGLDADDRFVIVGDLNASTVEGEATDNPMGLLLTDNSLVRGNFIPKSQGGQENDPDNVHAANHTAGWKMRVDYVLPSKFGTVIEQGAVFWPARDDALFALVGPKVQSSDHRLVWLDLRLTHCSCYKVMQ